MKLLICAGGTGGGIYPALAAVAELNQLGMANEQILWVGVKGEIEEQIVPRAGLRLECITGGGIVGVPRGTAVKNSIKLLWSVGSSLRIMRRFRPDVVLVTGGYMSVPVVVAAWLRRTPRLVFLPDLEPGTALRAIGRLATTVAASFAESADYFPYPREVVGTGYPVRAELVAASRMAQAEALATFDLTAERPTLFVFGGSRGAQSINRALLAHLTTYLASIQVIHVSGQLGWEEVAEYAEQLPAELRRYYRPYPYLHEEMGAGFAAADLIVARGGASMLGEGPLFGKPAILVPYPHAWRTQKINADYLVGRGAAVRLADEVLQDELHTAVLNLLHDKERLAEMSQSAANLANPTAARTLAELILDMGRG